MLRWAQVRPETLWKKDQQRCSEVEWLTQCYLIERTETQLIRRIN